MPRKLKKGYYVRGQFIAEGSELDLEYKAELKGTDAASKTDLKRESTELQTLGEQLITLRKGLIEPLGLSEKLTDALAEAKRITNFEGKRRQIQFIGKLMRLLQASAPETIVAIQAALVEQNSGSAESALLVHQAEQWRDRLIASDGALVDWLTAHPSTDTQALRSLIRQARKDAITPITPTTLPALARQAGLRQGHTHGHAYREIFQCVRDQLNESIEPTVS